MGERGRGVAGVGRGGFERGGNGCISQSDSHTETLKTLLYSTHRDEKKREDGSSGAGWENVGSMKTPGRSGGSAQSARFLHLRGVNVELGVAGHCLKKQTQTKT